MGNLVLEEKPPGMELLRLRLGDGGL
jgi:hypothetical protein